MEKTKVKALGLVLLLLALQTAGAQKPALFALEGTLRQETEYVYTVTATLDRGSTLEITLPIPQGWEQPGHRETILALEVEGDPAPNRTWDETDRWGNIWRTLRWVRPGGEVAATRHLQVVTETQYGPIFSSSPYPVVKRDLPWDVSQWLWPTSFVQSNRPEIGKRAAFLTAGCRTELEAVVRILNWVRANVRYACARELCEPVLRCDALFTLEKLKGNCVNFANLAMALLRAAGIPARPVHGFVADREKSSAGHAWISVYFPDLGWMDFESSNWMPTGREVPITFLLPQHISVYRGEGKGVSRGDFSETHTAQFAITQRPEERTELAAEVPPGSAVAWVITLRNPDWELRTFTLHLEGVPEGWYASLSEEQVTIDPDGPANTWDLLLTVIPPADAVAGEEATITVSARSEGKVPGTLTATVRVRAQS